MTPIPTDDAVKYRRTREGKLRNLLSELRGKPRWKDLANRLLAKDDLLAPAFAIRPETPAVDVLCALLDARGTKLAILHSRSKSDGPEGVGRTSLLLRSLGLSFDYASIGRRPNGTPIRGSLKVHRTVQADVRLLTSDFAYITNLGEQLLALPVAGEPILGLWDIARHIYRMIEYDYQSWKRLTPEGRSALEELMRVIPPELVLDCYGTWEKPHGIDTAVILEVSATATSPTVTSITESGACQEALLQAFESVRYLRSPFWERDLAAHRETARRILDRVKRLPEVYAIRIPMSIAHRHDKNRYIDELFGQFAPILESTCAGSSRGEDTNKECQGGQQDWTLP